MLILSGNDLTAREFRDHVARCGKWQGLFAQESVTIKELPDANHTFSTEEWRQQVSEWTFQWVCAHSLLLAGVANKLLPDGQLNERHGPSSPIGMETIVNPWNRE
ncbi:hypothetical protein [Ectothiorhodospira haloalkaliphila]|uniref:hypothetical protein n=1 Tax=Ectothiorhodospira haloalkaliphila TaxID=421628 RepID=UPI003B75D0F7